MLPIFESFVALRYVRAKRHNHFISFISLTSIVGMALGVMALITVLSVMNGFETELKERILGMASHATIMHVEGTLQDWQSISKQALQHTEIHGVAPFLRGEGMLNSGRSVNGVVLHGVIPRAEESVSTISDKMQAGSLDNLAPGEFRIIIGRELAQMLNVNVGDKIMLIVPKVRSTLIGILPQVKKFTVAGIFSVGMHEFDSALALIHLEDAMRLFQATGPSGLRLKTNDLLAAPRISREIASALPGYYRVIDWTQHHANFFRALKTEKTVMFVILTLIIAVAAFNIISTLVMMVADKQADIAVLRTLGANPLCIMQIFMLQGIVIGSLGICIGIISGVWLTNSIEYLIPAIEKFFDAKFLPPDIYYISDLPAELQWSDVLVIGGVAFLFCLLATIYPAWRAAKVQPAEALRYE